MKFLSVDIRNLGEPIKSFAPTVHETFKIVSILPKKDARNRHPYNSTFQLIINEGKYPRDRFSLHGSLITNKAKKNWKIEFEYSEKKFLHNDNDNTMILIIMMVLCKFMQHAEQHVIQTDFILFMEIGFKLNLLKKNQNPRFLF